MSYLLSIGHTRTIVSDFTKLLHKTPFPDIVFRLKDGKSCRVHKAILEARVPTFFSLFSTEKEVGMSYIR